MEKLIHLFDKMVRKGASDLHLQVGTHPYYRILGMLGPDDGEPVVSVDFMENAVDYLLVPFDRERFEKNLCVDFAHVLEGVGRLRCSVYHQNDRVGAAFRLIPEHLPTFEELGLPEIVRTIAKFPRGLVLVVGPTGSGKTTTLATMINYINHTRSEHILTLEDPIEYKHKNMLSLIDQREVGRDCMSFHDGIREALRQDPDVVLVGEMRDLETTSMALTAAETGHLVLATLHTSGAADTINRIIDIYPPAQQPQIRTQLSICLRAVVSQVLVRMKDGKGRRALFEVMMMTNAVRNLIRENKVFQIDIVLQSGKQQGMVTLEHSIKMAIQTGYIDKAKGVELANDPDDLLEFLLEEDAESLDKDREKGEKAIAAAKKDADAIRRDEYAASGYGKSKDEKKPITFGAQETKDGEDDWFKQQEEWQRKQQERMRKK